MMGLADLAVAVVQPLLKEKLRSWDPLKVCFSNVILKLIIDKLPLFILFFHYFRTALIVWKTSVSGEQSSNLETSIAVPQIQTWTLTTGHFKHASEAVLTHLHTLFILARC